MQKYYPIGSGVEELRKLIDVVGGIDEFYNLYYKTMLKSITCDLGEYKPRRIGHPTLVRKYKESFPKCSYNIDILTEIIKLLKENKLEIDLNTSGLRKEKCKEVYPSGVFMKLLLDNEITMVLGSDSHESKDVGFYFKNINDYIKNI